MTSSRSKLIKAFRDLTKPRFSSKSFLQGAHKCHVESLLTEEPDAKMKEDEEDKVGEILSQFDRGVGLEGYSSDLKELFEKRFNQWVPKDKLIEKCRLQRMERRKSESKSKKRQRRSSSRSENDNANSEEDALDPADVRNERMQDADEEDDELSSCSTDDRNDGDVELPLIFEDVMSVKAASVTLKNVTNIWGLSGEDRVDFVYALQSELMPQKEENFSAAANEYEENRKIFQEIRNQHTVDILRNHNVIGMTVTGAAMRLSLLNQIKPCAVIVEEAAEILEGQLVSVLPPTTKYLVMLGDQKQLKPHVSCFELKKYKHLDCSLFERLINNGLDYQQLGRQCRMNDNIADLLRVLGLYKDLKTNEEKTRDNHPPECVEECMYFFKHTHEEQDMPGSNSKFNPREISEIVKVCQYLLKNDCRPEDITVLSAYRGQVERMKDRFMKDDSFEKLKDIKVTTVDSFQGDENKVILLSLVRGNSQGNIGFFAEQNRVCVAVSRAKCALYLFGNVVVYKNSSNWKKIIDFLERKGLVGTRFPYKNDRATDGGKSTPTPLQKFLSQNFIQQLGNVVSTKWDRLARLLNIDEQTVDEICHNAKDYRDFPSKAVKIIQEYKKAPDADMEELLHWLEFLEIHVPDEICELYQANKPDERKTVLKDETDAPVISNTTPLSPREIERLSTKVPHKWQPLAGLLDLSDEQVRSIVIDALYPDHSQKAAKMLSIYNNKKRKSFSRQDLANFLEEIGLSQCGKDVLNGTLRKRRLPNN